MGVAPCGLLKDEKDVIYLARTQASVTHRSETAALAATIAALSVFYMRQGVKPDQLWQTVRSKFSLDEIGYIGFLSHTGENPVSQNAIDITTAAIRAVETGETLAGVLRNAVSYQGDTDTVAALAMAIATAGNMEDDIPEVLKNGLENGPYGAGYLHNLDCLLS